MRYLFLAPRYHTNLHYMLMALKQNGHDVHISVLYQGKSENYSVVEPVVLGYSPLYKLISRIFNRQGGKLIKNDFEIKYSFPCLFKLLGQLRKVDPDVVVIKDIQNLYSLMSMTIARLMGKKIIVLLQIKKYREKPRSYSVYLAGKIFGAKVVTPILGDEKFKNNNENLYYIPFAIDVQDFSKSYFKDGKINIMMIGKFQERKGHLLLAEAANNLKAKYNLKVLLVGQRDEEPYTHKLIEYIKTNNLGSVIELRFEIHHSLMTDIYRENDIYILPSWSEAAAVTPIEAMANKLAVISSDDNGTACYVQNGINGYVFKKKDVADLTAKIELIINNKDNIIKMGAESFRIAQEHHSLKSFNDSIIKLVC